MLAHLDPLGAEPAAAEFVATDEGVVREEGPSAHRDELRQHEHGRGLDVGADVGAERPQAARPLYRANTADTHSSRLAFSSGSDRFAYSEADGSVTRAGVLREVRATSHRRGILGFDLSFAPNGDAEGASFYMFQVVGDRFELVQQVSLQ